jgi:glutamyl-tRNA synthetase
LRVPDEELAFDDQFCGRHCVNVQRQVGDFIVIAKAGLPAYQLAVVVDDARQSVTDIVRGDDLLRSTGRQLWLYRLLGLTPLPSYWHVPLVLGPDGKRLAKRHGDTRVAWYRDHGVMPERIVGLMAYWYDLVDSPVPMNSQEFLKLFSQAQVTRIPTEPITFTAKDHSWLTAG